MPNYANAVLYIVVSANGSTTQKLKKRLSEHVYEARPHTKGSCTSRFVINAGAYSIHVLQPAPCSSKQELVAIERKYIENLHCVNKNVPGRSKNEYQRVYRQANADTEKKKKKAYYQATAETQQAQSRARKAWRKSFGVWYSLNEYGTLCDIHPTLFN